MERKRRPTTLQEVYYSNPEPLDEGAIDTFGKILKWISEALGITVDRSSKIIKAIATVEKASGVSPLYGEVPWNDWEGIDFAGLKIGGIDYILELEELADNKTATGRLLRLTGAFAGKDATYEQVVDVYSSMPGWAFLDDLTVLQAGMLYKNVLATTSSQEAFVRVQKLMPEFDGDDIRDVIKKINKDTNRSQLALRAMAAIASYAGSETYESAADTAKDLVSGGAITDSDLKNHVDSMRLGTGTPVKAVAMILKAMTTV